MTCMISEMAYLVTLWILAAVVATSHLTNARTNGSQMMASYREITVSTLVDVSVDCEVLPIKKLNVKSKCAVQCLSAADKCDIFGWTVTECVGCSLLSSSDGESTGLPASARIYIQQGMAMCSFTDFLSHWLKGYTTVFNELYAIALAHCRSKICSMNRLYIPAHMDKIQ